MAIYYSKEKVAEIVAKHGGNEKNTGLPESQIALFTFRIQSLSQHLEKNKKDFSCKRTLLTLVGKRKSLLQYLMRKDITRYRKIIEELNIRK